MLQEHFLEKSNEVLFLFLRYQQAEIVYSLSHKGFGQTSYSDHFFDVVIGNIPFNSIRVDDPRYNRNGGHHL